MNKKKAVVKYDSLLRLYLFYNKYIHTTEFPYDFWSCKRRHQKNVYAIDCFIVVLYFSCFVANVTIILICASNLTVKNEN